MYLLFLILVIYTAILEFILYRYFASMEIFLLTSNVTSVIFRVVNKKCGHTAVNNIFMSVDVIISVFYILVVGWWVILIWTLRLCMSFYMFSCWPNNFENPIQLTFSRIFIHSHSNNDNKMQCYIWTFI